MNDDPTPPPAGAENIVRVKRVKAAPDVEVLSDDGNGFWTGPPPDEAADPEEPVALTDFDAYMPLHSYMFRPTRSLWPASSVNARIPPVRLTDADGQPLLDDNGRQKTLRANVWLDQHKPVEQMTWMPGEPYIIDGRLIDEGGWIERPGCRCLNLYRPPTIIAGDPLKAGPWIDHVKKIYGEYAPTITLWFAHRAQKPHEKINHALVLGGAQGIGKDTIVEPVKAAIGSWNFSEAAPQRMLGRFNKFVRAVIMRVNEGRDLGDFDRYAFYEHMKLYTAAPPDTLTVDEKHLREYAVPNVCGVIITTNHKSNGIFLPQDDRRHYVTWSNHHKEDFDKAYWDKLWAWYANGGLGHVAAYLRTHDISAFNAKAPPEKTAAWWEIVTSYRAPEDAELADALDALKNPAVVTLDEVLSSEPPIPANFAEWLRDRKNRGKIPHRFEACDYVPFRNSDAKDGLWVIEGKRQVVYAQSKLSIKEQHDAYKYRYTAQRRYEDVG